MITPHWEKVMVPSTDALRNLGEYTKARMRTEPVPRANFARQPVELAPSSFGATMVSLNSFFSLVTNGKCVSSVPLRTWELAQLQKRQRFFEKSTFFEAPCLSWGDTLVHRDSQVQDLEENPSGQGPCPRSQDGKEPKHAQENTWLGPSMGPPRKKV